MSSNICYCPKLLISPCVRECVKRKIRVTFQILEHDIFRNKIPYAGSTLFFLYCWWFSAALVNHLRFWIVNLCSFLTCFCWLLVCLAGELILCSIAKIAFKWKDLLALPLLRLDSQVKCHYSVKIMSFVLLFL